MKNNIFGFNQKAIISFEQTKEINGKTVTQRLDVTDLLLLHWFSEHWNSSAHKSFIDGKVYMHVFYNDILYDFPILAMGKQSLFRRFKKLAEFGILIHHTYIDPLRGSRSMYGIGEEFYRIIEE